MKSLVFVSLLASSVSFAADISEFDIAGVKLGMSISEVTAIVRDQLGVDEELIKVSDGNNRVTENTEPMRVEAKGEDFWIDVIFVPNVPPYEDGSSVLAETVKFGQSSLTQEKMFQAAVEKFGEPDKSFKNGLFWCTRTKGGLGQHPCNIKIGPYGEVQIGRLKLHDPTFRVALQEFLNSKAVPKF